MRLPFTHRFSYALAVSLGLLAPIARAETPPSRPNVASTAAPIDPAKHAEWLRLGQTARERALHGDYEGATELYKKALELEKSSDVLFALGMSEARADHHLDAVIDLRRYVDEPDAEPSKIALAKSLLPKLSESLGHVNIDDSPLAATFIDGAPLRGIHREPDSSGDTVEFVDVEPGTHEFTATAPGKRWHSSVTVKAGDTVTAVFKLDLESETRPLAPIGTQPVAPVSIPPVKKHDSADRGSNPAFWIVMGTEEAAFIGMFFGGFAILSDGINNPKYGVDGSRSKQILGSCVMGGALIGQIGVPIITDRIWANALNKSQVSIDASFGPGSGGLVLHGSF